MQRLERAGGAVDRARVFPEQRAIAVVAHLAQAADLLRRSSPLGEEMPRPAILAKVVLEIVGLRQRDAGGGHDLLRRLKVEPLGVDEDAVVVPEDRFDHAYG